MLGKIVFEADVKANMQIQIKMDDLSAGAYILSVFNGKEQVYQTKVICVK